MSIHKPGPQLFSSIPFKHLAQHGKGGKSTNIHLNLVPFVDMMTILVTFLLVLFGTAGRVVPQPGLDMVKGQSERDLIQAAVPTLVITKGKIFIDKVQGQDYNFLDFKEGRGIHAGLKDYLSSERKKWQRRFEGNQFKGEVARCSTEGMASYVNYWRKTTEEKGASEAPQLCARGVAILQADKDTPAKMITRVVRTLQAADYPTIMFAVAPQEGGA